MKRLVPVLGLLAVLSLAMPSYASLTAFRSFNGKVGVSTDGFGSTTNSGTISASVPVGSTVLEAYLYTAYFDSGAGAGATLGGNAVTFGPAVNQTPSCCGLGSRRANVTSLVKPIIDAGPGGVYNFSLTEAANSQDGEALVIVYSNPTLSETSIGILDGFSASSADSFAINFADPLNPASPGFTADMRLGTGFSCCGQNSTVTVNGTVITRTSGNHDDGLQQANGSLITVGGFDDPFSPLLPSYTDDHERYNLTPHITAGDTTINVQTRNPSGDDNIFLAVFQVSGRAGFNEPPPPPSDEVPEPSTMALFGSAVAGIGFLRLRGRRKHCL